MITGAGTQGATGTAEGGAPAPPPTEIERELYAAARHGSGTGGAGAHPVPDAVLDVLARTRLYLLVPRLHADTPGYAPPLPANPDPATGRTCVPVLTPGMLPPWHPEWVFRQVPLGELARVWPDNTWRLAVNPGTPYAMSLEARPKHRKAWAEAYERNGRTHRAGLLLTHGGGHLHGPLAHGLALGAQLAVHNSLVWNQLGAAYEDYATDIDRLRNPWHVNNRADYRRTLEALLETRMIGTLQEFALRTRHGMVRQLGRAPSEEEWTSAVTTTLRHRGTDAEDLAEAVGSLRCVLRFEARLRADGALAPDGRVDSLKAFDYGRAVNVVRLALGARYITPPEAEEAVLRIDERARRAYGSWADFSLGYAMTRLIYFTQDAVAEAARGEGGSGAPGPLDPRSETKYQESLAQHRILTQDPAGPYRNIPWS
ncbi:DUF1266 domain-containing protein [Streptomyces sp. NPDC004111]|uniref:DUF1266 domain-containing protein n=1 Tax=Streptomyces sp. NPDC004111 TaxID=3364690 RepID=UPI0036ACA3DA